jgi:predicted RNA-binding protein with PUA domain
MAVQKDFKSGRALNIAAGAEVVLIDEALTGQELVTVERLGATPHADLRLTLEVERTVVYKEVPTEAAAYPASDTNAEVFVCAPVVGILPEKRWKVVLKNVGAGVVASANWYIPITRYTGADLPRVL